MSINSIHSMKQPTAFQNDVQVRGKYSTQLPSIARKAATFALGAITIFALANVPTAEAGAGAYWSCIQTCAAGGMDWIKTFLCPTICAPFLLAPG